MSAIRIPRELFITFMFTCSVLQQKERFFRYSRCFCPRLLDELPSIEQQQRHYTESCRFAVDANVDVVSMVITGAYYSSTDCQWRSNHAVPRNDTMPESGTNSKIDDLAFKVDHCPLRKDDY
jgi:hypothetical protein